MSVGTTAALVMGGISAAGSLASGFLGSHAASSAANQQVAAETKALDFQNQVYGTQVANEQPYVDAGAQSIGSLMKGLQNGTYGAGSNPNFNGGPAFTAPTAAQAAQTPGYQFTLQQGMRGVNASAAAKGGALSGGAVKAAQQYGAGLADSTYNNVFNRSLAGYQTNFQDSLATYQQNLAKQQQEFGQQSAVAQIGQQGISSINNTGTQAATNIGSIMGNIGNAQAAGTVGSANAWSSAIGGITGAANNSLALYKLSQPTPGYSAAIGNGGAPIPSSVSADGTPIFGA